jgi:ribosomal protein S18 acetylase RimI-like enzyme
VPPYDEWLYPTTLPTFDPNLWWVALDGTEVVGMALAEIRNTDYGWIGIVGVRRPWRRRGIALAMLTHCLAAFQERNVRQIELGVDADNVTRPLGVYERAGMRIADVRPTYCKNLRSE